MLCLSETFEACLRQEQPSSEENILVHGISGGAQLAGEDPAEALVAFLGFLGADMVVAFHAGFDARLITRALRAHLGVKLRRNWFDAGRLLAALLPEDTHGKHSLDHWLERFGVSAYSRHDPLSDATATAELVLVALELAIARGIGTARELHALCAAHKELSRLHGPRGWS